MAHSHVRESPSEKANLRWSIICSQQTQYLRLWLLRGRARPFCLEVIHSSLRCTPRGNNRCCWSGGTAEEVELSRGDSVPFRCLLHRVHRAIEATYLLKMEVYSTCWCTMCRTGFSQRVDARASLGLDRDIAPSPRAQRRCTSYELGKCKKAVSPTNPWKMMYINAPRPLGPVWLWWTPPPPSLSRHGSPRDRHRPYQSLVNVLP